MNDLDRIEAVIYADPMFTASRAAKVATYLGLLGDAGLDGGSAEHAEMAAWMVDNGHVPVGVFDPPRPALSTETCVRAASR